MLTVEDRQFLIQVMDKGKYEGIQACLKCGEVFIKLQQEIANEQKEMVPEPDHVVELDSDTGGSDGPAADAASGDSAADVCDIIRERGDAERSPSDVDNAAG